MDNEIIDFTARQQSAMALEKISAHEANCGERWREARDQMRGVKTTQWWMITTLVLGQGALIIFLADRLF